MNRPVANLPVARSSGPDRSRRSAAVPTYENALTCGKTGQGIVEVAGIEPASSGFSVGLLRAQPVLDCQDQRRYRQQRRSVSD